MLFKIDQKKWDNFWYYYKVHVIVGVFIGILILTTIKDCAQRVNPDVSWGYMGTDLTAEAVENVEQAFADIIQDTNNDGKKKVFIFALMDIQQITVMLASGDTQIFVFDQENFTNFAKGGAFQPLDELINTYQVDLEQHPEVRLKALESDEEHVYGLPLEGNPLLQNLGLQPKGKYLGIRIPKNSGKPQETISYQNVYVILEKLVTYTPQ